MAVQSMTGFGRAEGTSGSITISVEMKSVNHRFLDISCKLPSAYQRVEPDILKGVRGELRRGRVDIFVVRAETGASGAGAGYSPALNESVFRAALKAYEQGFRAAGVVDETLIALEAAKQALSTRGVIEGGAAEPDMALETPVLIDTAARALVQLKAMRAEEGKALQQEFALQLKRFEALVSTMDSFAATSPQQFQDRLKERTTRLLSGTECDPQRLAQEVALLVERADVTEELTRLRSHIVQFRQTLDGNEGGKKLEFLLQEMGREVNTTGSKSQSVEIGQAVVEAKLVLERLREQVLNVE